MNFLSVFGVVPIIWQLVESLVKTVESDVVPGAQKKQLVLTSIKSILELVGKIPGIKVPLTTAVVLAIADPIIDIVVSIFNVIGVFKTSGGA